MDESTNPEGGLFSTVTRIVKTLRETVENRIELFLLEAREDRLRLLDLLILAAIGVALAMMTIIVATFTIVVLFWDSYRILTLVILTLAYGAAAAIVIANLRSKIKNWRSFQATFDQLQKDRECFKKKS